MLSSLTPRLNAVLNLTPHCGTIADIGCDHGKLTLALLQSGRAENVIAVDVSAPSLEKARELFNQREYSAFCDRVSFRVGDGLKALSEREYQAAVIAGMGGRLIAEILRHVQKGCEYILQPMQHVFELRESLLNHGFEVLDELCVREDRRIYEVMRVRLGGVSPTDEFEKRCFEEVGPILWQRRDELAFCKLRARRAALCARLDELRGHNTDGAQKASAEISHKLDILNSIINAWQ